MRYPKLNPSARRQVLIDRFRGYEHLPQVSAGAFYEMERTTSPSEPAPAPPRQRSRGKTERRK